MRTLDNSHKKPEERWLREECVALRKLVSFQCDQIEALNRQLERYAEDFGVLLSVSAETDDDGAVSI